MRQLGTFHVRLTSFALATALITAPGLASAQSVLKRVLGQIDSATNLAQVNGTFANIAENVGQYSPDIDGSITNIITGATAEAAAGAATAAEFVMPTLDFGDMATTALGAVNTGVIFPIEETDEIMVGVNFTVDRAMTITAQALSSKMTVIGGSADTGAMMFNVASNVGAINGSIQNTMAQVNGTIGNLSTTALGVVNTGTITSGVNAAVQGIVGMSEQTTSSL